MNEEIIEKVKRFYGVTRSTQNWGIIENCIKKALEEKEKEFLKIINNLDETRDTDNSLITINYKDSFRTNSVKMLKKKLIEEIKKNYSPCSLDEDKEGVDSRNLEDSTDETPFIPEKVVKGLISALDDVKKGRYKVLEKDETPSLKEILEKIKLTIKLYPHKHGEELFGEIEEQLRK